MGEVAWVATVFPDWTTLQLGEGEAFAFNRQTGRVYKIPHPECPYLLWPHVQNSTPIDGGTRVSGATD